MTGVARAHFETLRSIAAAGISGSYAAVGIPLVNQVRAFCITNTTQGDMIFSLDDTNVNGNMFVAAGSYKLYDVQTNINPKFDDSYVLSVGEQFYVKQITAPVDGDIWIECIY